MPNEILFAGGRRETVTIVSGTVTEVTTAGTYDATYSDCALQVQGSGNVFKVDLYSETTGNLSKVSISGAGSKLFVHVAINYGASAFAPSNRIIELVDSSGFPWFGIRGSGSNNTRSFGIYWNSGTGASPVWTQMGTPEALESDVFTLDIEFTFGTPHSVNVYQNNSLWKSGTFTQGSFTNVAEVRFGGTSTAGGQPSVRFSQILITDNISTIGSFVRTTRATAAGANAGFTNDHTAVNEVVVSDATLQSAASAGLRTTHVMSDVVVPTGLEIGAVFHWFRARNTGVAPNNVRSVLRSGGIDYVTPDITLIGASFVPVGARYNVDVLGTNWTEAEWNGIEAGYESAT